MSDVANGKDNNDGVDSNGSGEASHHAGTDNIAKKSHK